jgi:hypothetical protein
MVTLALVRRGVGALITKHSLHSTRSTNKNFNHKHIEIIIIIRRNMHAICDLNTTMTLSTFSGWLLYA